MSKKKLLVSVVVVHYNHEELLRLCLESLAKQSCDQIEVLVVSNCEKTSTYEQLVAQYPKFSFIQNESNRGFGDACNVGYRASTGQYVFFLNNDVELEPDCIGELRSVLEGDHSIGAAQPKLLCSGKSKYFEYAGAAGGRIDILGYPFARGRIFDSIELDNDQYPNVREIFWASGAAMFLRASVFDRSGGFDSDFFMHMEEIDLAWRIHYIGCKIVYVPTAIVRHVGSPSLGRNSFQQMYFNHRNSIITLIKNYPTVYLLLLLPPRIALEMVTIAESVVVGDGVRAKAVGSALYYLVRHPIMLWNKRRSARKQIGCMRWKVMKKVYWGSIVFQYYVLRRKTIPE